MSARSENKYDNDENISEEGSFNGEGRVTDLQEALSFKPLAFGDDLACCRRTGPSYSEQRPSRPWSLAGCTLASSTASATRETPGTLAYRATVDGRVEILSITSAATVTTDGDEVQCCKLGEYSLGTNHHTTHEFPVRAVRLAVSSDGRMIAVACDDGSLQCLDVMMLEDTAAAALLSPRWKLTNAHSHISNRDGGCGGALVGISIIRSLEFSPHGYFLLLVGDGVGGYPRRRGSGGSRGYVFGGDGGGGVKVYDASASRPFDLVPPEAPGDDSDGSNGSGGRVRELLRRASSAAWSPKIAGYHDDKGMKMAVGSSVDGSIHVVGFFPGVENVHGVRCRGRRPLFRVVASLVAPPMPNGDDPLERWSCTHLHWFSSSPFFTDIAAGFCRVLPADEEDDNESSDSKDEDDPAEHEVAFHVGSMALSDDKHVATWTENMGLDLAPFFSVPKGARHSFFTAYLPIEGRNDHAVCYGILLVGSNLSNDVGVVSAKPLEGGRAYWERLDLEERSNATTPTNEDDEFTYPTGLASFQVVTSLGNGKRMGEVAMLLSSTDGQISVFGLKHSDISDFGFCTLDLTVGTFLGGDAEVEAPAVAMPPLSPDAVEATTTFDEEDAAGPVAVEDAVTKHVEDAGVPAPEPATVEGTGFGAFTASSSSSKREALGFAPRLGAFSSTTLSTTSSSSSSSSSLAGAATVKASNVTTTGEFSFGGGSASSSTAGANFAGFSFGESTGTSGSTLGTGGFSFGSASSQQQAPSSCGAAATAGFAFGSAGKVSASSSSSPSGSTFGMGTGGGLSFGSATRQEVGGGGSSFPVFGSSAGGGGTQKTSPTAVSFGDLAASSTVAGQQKTSPFATFSAPPFSTLSTFKAKSLAVSGGSNTRLSPSMVKPLFGTPKKSASPVAAAPLNGSEGDGDLNVAALSKGSSPETASAKEPILVPDEGEDNDQDKSSLDSDEKAERDEEYQKAHSVFTEVSNDGAGLTISTGDFPKLMEAMGTTYCEEEHCRTLKRIAKDGSVSRDDFVSWYIEWLFGNDGEGDEVKNSEEEEDDDEDATESRARVLSSMEGWDATFGVAKEGSWKCDACMISNRKDATQCAACETRRPGLEDNSKGAGYGGKDATTTLKTTTSSPSGIGSGGFTFGGCSDETAVAATTKTLNSSSSLPRISAGGFIFGGSGERDGTTGIGARGFTFGSKVADTAALKVNNTEDTAVSHDEKDEQKKAGDEDVQDIGDDLYSFSSLDSDEREEREEELQKARSKFSDVSNGGSTISKEKFPTLMKAMGTTYCEEEHGRALKSISSGNGIISRKAFISWYINWLFADDTDVEEEEDGIDEDRERADLKSKMSSKQWASTFGATEEGSWKCNSCMVRNKKDASKCAACETQRFSKDATIGSEKSATVATTPALSSSGIFARGFTFGDSGLGSGDDATKASVVVPKKTSISSSSGIGARGFIFGGDDGEDRGGKVADTVGLEVKNTADSGISNDEKNGGKMADEEDNQGESDISTSYSSLDSDEREEREEELQKARLKFSDVSGGGSTISNEKFPILMKAMGTTYCEEEHGLALKRIASKDGTISRKAFVAWYMHWLFADESDEEEEEEGEDKKENRERQDEQSEMSSKQWAKTFGATEEGSWKCDVCMVQNKKDASKCAACEAPKDATSSKGEGATMDGDSGLGSRGDAAKRTVAANAKTSTSSSSSIGAGGFTFRGGVAEDGSGSSGIGAAGFTFGGKVAGTVGSAVKEKEDTSNSNDDSNDEKDGGGFNFGGVTAGAQSGVSKTTEGSIPSGTSRIRSGGITFGFVGGTNTAMRGVSAKKEMAGISLGGLTFGGKATVFDTAKTCTSAATTTEERASIAFDAIDVEKRGKLPSSSFESLLEELGEGFHGPELEKQLRLVLDRSGGVDEFDKASFTSWYSDLVGGDEGRSTTEGSKKLSPVDSEEEAERAEQMEKAVRTFQSISGMKSSILVDDFGKLMEAMGTTYCEEEHTRTIRKISSGGKVTQDAFTSWYIDWLFDEDEQEDDSEEEEDEVGVSDSGYESDDEIGASDKDKDRSKGRGKQSFAKVSSLGWDASFGAAELGSWKCESCMVRNKRDHDICAACETARQGSKPQKCTPKSTPKSTPAGTKGSAGLGLGPLSASSGWTFGVPTSAPEEKNRSLTFGVPTIALEEKNSKKLSESVVGTGKLDCGGSASGGVSSGMGGAASNVSPTVFKALSSGIASVSSTGFSFGPLPKATSPSTPTIEHKPVLSSVASTAPMFGFTKKDAKKPSRTAQPVAHGSGVSKAPTTDASAPVLQASGAGVYPPMPKEAPTPFGGRSSHAPSGSGSYPNISSKTSISSCREEASGSSNELKASGAGDYPHLSFKTPTSFGGGKAPAPALAVKSSGAGSHAPFSFNAPTPFGGGMTSTAVPERASAARASGGGYQAPTSSGEKAGKACAAGSYPPLPSKAPTPFGGGRSAAPAPGAKTSGEGYSPIIFTAPSASGGSKAASASSAVKKSGVRTPTPFSSKAPPPPAAATISSTGAYPPMSVTAPKRFGGDEAAAPATVVKSSGTGAYPPLSSKAPTTPFFGTATQKEKDTKSTGVKPVASSSGYPPMSSKAPTTPFFEAHVKKDKGTKISSRKPSTAASDGYPPLSSKAPTPFSGAGRPMSSRAPTTQFSATAMQKDGGAILAPGKSAASSVSYPPMSSKAPTSFSGAGGANANTSRPADTAGANPLMSKAPTLFGGVGDNASAPLSAAKPGTLGGFPPMSTKAPSTAFFGAATSTAKSVASPFSFSGIGKVPASEAVTPSKSLAQSMDVGALSLKTPTSTHSYGGFKSEAPASVPSAEVNASSLSKQPTTTKPFGASVSGKVAVPPPHPVTAAKKPFRVSSEYEAQVWNSASGMSSSLSLLHKYKETVASSTMASFSSPSSSDSSIAAFESNLQRLSDTLQKVKVSVCNTSDTLKVYKERSVFLLSQGDDLYRQIKESKRLLGIASSSSSSYSDLMQKQPLDSESDHQRRRLAAKTIETKRALGNVLERVRLTEKIFHLVDKEGSMDRADGGPVTSSGTVMEGNKSLFLALKTSFERTKELDASVDKLEKQAVDMFKLIPSAESPVKAARIFAVDDPSKQRAGVDRAQRFGGKGRRVTIPRSSRGSKDVVVTARPLDAALPRYSPVASPPSASAVAATRLSEVESAIRAISNAPDCFPVKKCTYTTVPMLRSGSEEEEKKAVSSRGGWRRSRPGGIAVARSQLMNSPELSSSSKLMSCPSRATASSPGIQFTSQILFGSPASSGNANAMSSFGSDVSGEGKSILDRAKQKTVPFSLPKNEKLVKVSDAARDALVALGTTPEKTARARETLARGLVAEQHHQKQQQQQQAQPSALANRHESNRTSSKASESANNASFPLIASDGQGRGSSDSSSNTDSSGSSSRRAVSGSNPKKASARAEAAPFPPLSNKAPTAFSQPKSLGEKDKPLAATAAAVAHVKTKAKDAKPEGPKSVGADTASSNESKDTTASGRSMFGTEAKGGAAVGANSLFGNLRGFSEALGEINKTTAAAKSPSSSAASTTAISSGLSLSGSGETHPFAPKTSPLTSSQQQQQQQQLPDYKSILVSFYQKYNTSKIGDVDNFLAKYKGKEAEMFAKLANKYNAPNPLESEKGAKSAPSPPVSSSSGTAVGSPAVKSSPFGSISPVVSPPSGVAPLSAQTPGAVQPDYRSILFAFYQKHNPNKVGDVDNNLAKYKGKEPEMFAKLAAKYKVPNPLGGVGPFGAAETPHPTTQPSPFTMSSATTSTPSPFGHASGAFTAKSVVAPAPSPFGGGGMVAAPSPSPFSGSVAGQPAAPTSPFQGPIAAAVGPSSSFASMSPFSSTAGKAQGAPPGTPMFGVPTASNSPFRTAAPGPSPFTAQATATATFGGRHPRDILVAFYQQYNPTKVAEVDKLLAKYAGKEDQLFRNLAKKYNLDESMFGIGSVSATTPSLASSMAASSSAAAFGSGIAPAPSPFGATPAPSTTSPVGAFGQASTLGVGGSATAFCSTMGASPFGSSAVGATKSSGFGSLAAGAGGDASTFGRTMGGGGGGFGSVSGGNGFGFGQGGAFPGTPPVSTPFGGARR